MCHLAQLHVAVILTACNEVCMCEGQHFASARVTLGQRSLGTASGALPGRYVCNAGSSGLIVAGVARSQDVEAAAILGLEEHSGMQLDVVHKAGQHVVSHQVRCSSCICHQLLNKIKVLSCCCACSASTVLVSRCPLQSSDC